MIRPQAVVLRRADATLGHERAEHVAGHGHDIDRLGDRVRVELDGTLPLTAEITAAALDALGLRPGDDVHATVKATDIEYAIRLRPREMTCERQRKLLLGEWACLGILYQGPTHGFAIAARLKPDGDVGRVWSLSRGPHVPLAGPAEVRGYVTPVGRSPASPAATARSSPPPGRAGALRRWVATPVAHLRDLRSELLLKLVLAEQCGIDVTDMLIEQRSRFEQLAAALGPDVEAAATTPRVRRPDRRRRGLGGARRGGGVGFLDRIGPLTGRADVPTY